jgi:hypothetical protein
MDKVSAVRRWRRLMRMLESLWGVFEVDNGGRDDGCERREVVVEEEDIRILEDLKGPSFLTGLCVFDGLEFLVIYP